MAKFVYFTEEQKEQVRKIDLVAYLNRNGYKLKRAGSDYVWESPQGKVSIRGNRWYHQYDREGGYVISFFQRFFDMSFQEAMKMLLEEQGIPYETMEEEVKEKKAFELPKANGCMRRIFAYLLKERHLDKDVIQYFVHRKLIYEDEEYHNVIFVGRDEEGIPRHAHKRGASGKSCYKGNIESSNPDYSFHYVGPSNKIYVFEAPLDMLSYISLHKENWKEHSYVALCSVATKALVYLLNQYPHLTEVHPCLDHDKAGIEGDYRILEKVRELGDYTIKPELPKYKDWNEELKASYGMDAIPAQDHPGLVKMKTLCAEMVEAVDGIKIKNYLEHLKNRFEILSSISLRDDERMWEQSYELSWIAFLFGKSKLESMEKHYSLETYAKMLYQLYPPHKDNVGYQTRLADIRDGVFEILKVYQKDAIITETEQMEWIKKVMQLSVDCLRFSMYAENRMQEKIFKQKAGEQSCRMSQV